MPNWSKQQLFKTRRNIHLAAASLPDEAALETPELFPPWEHFRDYAKGDRCRDEGVLYRCLQDHTSQPMWTPKETPALWALVDDPGEEWPEWEQPLGSEDAYMAGAKVSHNGKHWISKVPANVWEPGVYGWEEQPENAETGGGESGATVQSVEWHQCPEAVQEYLANADYTGVPYTESVIGNYAPYPADPQTNSKPEAATVGSESFYNCVPNGKTPFATENAAGTLMPLDPLRWIKSATANFRDLGGWPCDGGKVRYGMIYRSGNLAAADFDLLFSDLGIRWEIDLTADGEAAFPGKIRHVCHPAYAMYSLADAEAWETNLRAVMDAAAHGEPCVIHCSMGADRTGTLVCVLEGLLGVSQSNIDKDYELSSFAFAYRKRNENYQGGTADWAHLIAAIDALTGATFRDKCVTFALSVGITPDEINAFRAAMIDGEPEKIAEPQTEPEPEPEPEAPAVDGNLIPTSIDRDGSVYNGMGYEIGYKLKSNGTKQSMEGYAITGFIPFAYGQTIRFDRFAGTESSNGGFYFFDADFSCIACHRVAAMLTYGELTAGEPLSYLVPPAVYDDGKGYVVDISNAAYIRLSVKTENPQTLVCKIN